MKLAGSITRIARVNIKRGIKFPMALFARLTQPPLTTWQNTTAVLMYHRVNAYRRDELSIHPRNFLKQVQWLKKQGFRNMTMRELELLPPDAQLVEPHVIFTFDDGYEDNYLEALPILQAYGYTAIFYLVPEYIGTQKMYPWDSYETDKLHHNRLMTWEHARELVKAGMETGSHTMSHRMLTTLSDAEARREIEDSRLVLEEKLRIPVSSFSLPRGAYHPKHLRMIQESGYQSSCTITQGFWRGSNLFAIPRIAVLSSDDFFIFTQKITGRLEKWFHVMG